jgi:hypothetical protein
MKTHVRNYLAGLGLAALMLLGFPGVASAADGDSCTAITAVPFTISASGAYCLTKDLSYTPTSGDAISVTADNVTIDLGGHTLTNLAAGAGTSASGITAADHKNITIRNGTVRGFLYGILLHFNSSAASSGHVVEYIRAELNRYVGIQVFGSGSVARYNQVCHTGGSTVFGANADSFGLAIGGNGAQAVGNSVVDTIQAGIGTARGISVGTADVSDGVLVEGNHISNGILSSNSVGILVEGVSTHDTLVVNNRVTKMNVGVWYGGSFNGAYRDNLTFGVTTAYIATSALNAGNNQ